MIAYQPLEILMDNELSAFAHANLTGETVMYQTIRLARSAAISRIKHSIEEEYRISSLNIVFNNPHPRKVKIQPEKSRQYSAKYGCIDSSLAYFSQKDRSSLL